MTTPATIDTTTAQTTAETTADTTDRTTADTTDRTTASTLVSAIKADAEDTVARRIVLRRSTWERLVHLAEALEMTRGVEVSPIEVAAIALEAGLEEISGQGRSRQAGLSRTNKAPSGSNSRSKSGSSSRSRSGSGRRHRPLKLSPSDRSELDALLSSCRSTRARQRTIALWLGHHKRTIRTEHLRQVATDYDAYNVANFAQNMKKDGQFFSEKTDSEGKRQGWKLTRAGSRKAKELLEQALVA